VLFNSYEFLFIFLPAVFFIYFFLNHKKLIVAAKIWLVLASLFFYGWWNAIYLPLISASVLANFAVMKMMMSYDQPENYRSKRLLFFIGLIFNVGLLVYFKYMDFFISNTNALVGTELNLLHLALPLAISFFTLQQIAFLVDSYEGLVSENSFLNYVVFVVFFPQLIAGPIVHHREMMPQFSRLKNKVRNYANINLGLFIFSIGLFKKVVIADSFSVWASAGFDHAVSLTLVEAWFTSLSYTFQLYFDFSGYTDMAIGAALLFNIKLPANFNSPLKATGMIDFWSRWHMTLTNFITTYIYTPLVRSFEIVTFEKAMLATVITFLIAGLWHGASWMFVIFGGLHGLGLVTNHLWRKMKIKMHRTFAWFITFNYVNLVFVFFRAEDLDTASKVLTAMFSVDNIILPLRLAGILRPSIDQYFEYGNVLANIGGDYNNLVLIIIGFVLVLVFGNSTQLVNDSERYAPTKLKALWFSAMFTVSVFAIYTKQQTEFLYFNF